MNPFYQSYQKNQNGNSDGLINHLLESSAPVLSWLKSMNMTPEQRVRQMLQTGEMSQAQFEQLSRMADKATGRKR